MPTPGRFELDWPRIARWCVLGTIVMLLWLLFPVARCSLAAFRDTPITEGSEAAPVEPSQGDRERVEQGTGFWSTWGGSVKQCYREAPLLGQAAWKSNLLIGFGIGAVLARLAAWIRARRRRTFG